MGGSIVPALVQQHDPLGRLSIVGYGHLWCLGDMSGHAVEFALEHGGQYVMLLPDRDMIIVSAADC